MTLRPSSFLAGNACREAVFRTTLAVSRQLSTDYTLIHQKSRFFADFSFDRYCFLLLIPGPAQPRFLPGIGP